jgi:hypothetical protein
LIINSKESLHFFCIPSAEAGLRNSAKYPWEALSNKSGFPTFLSHLFEKVVFLSWERIKIRSLVSVSLFQYWDKLSSQVNFRVFSLPGGYRQGPFMNKIRIKNWQITDSILNGQVSKVIQWVTIELCCCLLLSKSVMSILPHQRMSIKEQNSTCLYIFLLTTSCKPLLNLWFF